MVLLLRPMDAHGATTVTIRGYRFGPQGRPGGLDQGSSPSGLLRIAEDIVNGLHPMVLPRRGVRLPIVCRLMGRLNNGLCVVPCVDVIRPRRVEVFVPRDRVTQE